MDVRDALDCLFRIDKKDGFTHVALDDRMKEEGLVGQPAVAQKHAAEHSKHSVFKRYGEADLDLAEQTYAQQGVSKPSRRSANRRKNQ